jgi:hypothetical protein
MSDIAPNYTRSARRSFPGGVVSFGDHRVCATESCGTQLSRYNKTDVCSVHDSERSPRR